MFKIGELVHVAHGHSKKIGLVVETKRKNVNQYCKIYWIDMTGPEWVFSGNLREFYE